MASRPKLENINFLYPVIIILVIVLATSAFVIVESGHVGVVITLGAVQPKPLPEGFHLKKPFVDKIEQTDIRLTKAVSKSVAASKDLQTVETQVSVQYSLTGAVAPRTYQRIGTRDVVAATVIEPAIQESVKAVTAQFTAEQLVTRRAEVKQQIQTAIESFIRVTLEDKDVSTALTIANVAITDFATLSAGLLIGIVKTERLNPPAAHAHPTLLSSFWSALLLEYTSTFNSAAYSLLHSDTFSTDLAVSSSPGSFFVVRPL